MNAILSPPAASYAPLPFLHPDLNAEFRQLRHQTKNALTAIMMHLSRHLTASGCPELADDIERRVMLTAKVSDALFGLTHAPAPLAARLRSLCDGMVGLLGDTVQHLTVAVTVEAGLPTERDTLLLRAAHELVGNAIKHGMYLRLIGRIEVSVASAGDAIVLRVSDDGWGFCKDYVPGEGLTLVKLLARPVGGGATLERCGDATVATLTVPGP